MENKIKLAVEFLREGKGFTVDDLSLEVTNNVLSVIGWSLFYNLENITKETALIEIEDIKILFKKMIASSFDLEYFSKNKIIKYLLYYDDSGKGSIIICSLHNDIFNWYLKM